MWKITVIFATFLSVATPALALDEPLIYRVFGLSPSDPLNIRAQPTASSKDIGDLANGTLIEVLELSALKRWGRIISGESNGWVSMIYLEQINRMRNEDTTFPLGLKCSGAEPFWFVDLTTNNEARFLRMGYGEINELFISRAAAGRVNGPYGFTSDQFSGVVEPRSCTDGMSDRNYGWTINLMLRRADPDDLNMFTGCCVTDFGQTP